MEPISVQSRKKGILFVAINHNRPLSDQGPFDIVLHKVQIVHQFRYSERIFIKRFD